jgi:integrating conjugative element protein (TIGR03757 family)
MTSNLSLPSFQLLIVGLLSSTLFSSGAVADKYRPDQPHVIEVFTSAQYPFVGLDTEGVDGKVRALEITVYKIDGIQSVENALSHDLPANPERSKRMALQRIQHLDAQIRSRMQSSAQGLAKAMQYGIDRYPAVVFDGQAVVYGVTDLQAAIGDYQTWRAGGRP